MAFKAVILVNPKHKDVLDELERECLRVRAMETAKAPKHGEIGNGRPNPSRGDENKNVTSTRGNSSEYRISRLKRDYPEVAARVEAGEFKTVAAAERAALAES